MYLVHNLTLCRSYEVRSKQEAILKCIKNRLQGHVSKVFSIDGHNVGVRIFPVSKRQ